MKIKFKLIGSFGVIIGLTIILGIFTMISLENIVKNYTQLAETDIQVLEHAQLLQKYVVDAETGQRGFIITGDEEFLEPYYSGIENFRSLVVEQKEYVSDHPEQVERLNRISILFDDWNRLAGEPEIEMGRLIAENLQSNANLERILSEGKGKSVLDRVRTLLNELNANLIESGNLEAQLLVSQIAKDVVDRETGQRGFIITGAEEFLDPFNQGQILLEIHLKELRILLEGDEVDLQILQLIEESGKEWLEVAGMPEIEARRIVNENPETLTDAATLLQSLTGKSILDEIRAEFEIFIAIEHEVSETNLANAIQTKENVEQSFVIGTILIVSVGTVIALYSANTFTKPLIKLGNASKLISQGKEVKIDTKGKDEISDLARSFKQMSDELRALDRKKEEFISMVSHELKTPLVPIGLYAELLLDGDSLGKLTEDQRKAIKTIHTSMLDLKHLINDILDVNKLELGKLKLRKQAVNVQDFVKETIEKLKPFTESAQAKLILDTKIDGTINADKNRIFQVISNLVKNALKFVPENKGVITIRVHEGKDSVVLFSVEDNGVGIPIDKQKKLFQKFYQVDSSATREHGGTGLGLSISQGIVETHGGKIWYDNDYKNGAKFKFTIPRMMK